LYAQISDELQNLKAQSEAHLKEKIHSQVLEEKLDKMKRENQEKTAQLCKVKQQPSKMLCFALVSHVNFRVLTKLDLNNKWQLHSCKIVLCCRL